MSEILRMVDRGPDWEPHPAVLALIEML